MNESLPLVAAERRGLSNEAADRVRDAILGGHFAPGAPLREVELAQALAVSRGAVREGLAILESEGLVRSVWHRGTNVIDVTREDVEELYAVRAALDRLAAVTAADRSTEEDLRDLDLAVDSIARAVVQQSTGPELVRLDLAFHDVVYRAARNSRLQHVWDTLRSQVHLFQLQRVADGWESYRDRVVEEHRELAGLIRSRDSSALLTIAEEHVQAARRSLLAHLPPPD